MSRYDVTGDEGEYEAGSNGQVLKNKAGINTSEEMNLTETDLLEDLYLHVFNDFPQALNIATLYQWHRIWLGNVYSWAGQIRTVDMSKPDIHFASPLQIAKLAERFDATYLNRFDELPNMDDEALVRFLAEVHVEFILIHPFREGNGRMSRLLLDVMAVKAGAEPLDYILWDTHKEYYFKAVQAGRDGDYQYIERLIKDATNTEGEV
jgi:cell filamentation protein